MDYGVPLVRLIDAILGASFFVRDGAGARGKARLLHVPWTSITFLLPLDTRN